MNAKMLTHLPDFSASSTSSPWRLLKHILLQVRISSATSLYLSDDSSYTCWEFDVPRTIIDILHSRFMWQCKKYSVWSCTTEHSMQIWQLSHLEDSRSIELCIESLTRMRLAILHHLHSRHWCMWPYAPLSSACTSGMWRQICCHILCHPAEI